MMVSVCFLFSKYISWEKKSFHGRGSNGLLVAEELDDLDIR